MQQETLDALLANGAERVEIGGNAPIRLDATSYAWYVVRGKVELFAVETRGAKDAAEPDDASQVSTAGPRIHLATIETGEMLFGLEPQRSRRRARPDAPARQRAMVLIAVGLPQTELYKVPISAFAALARAGHHIPELERTVETWVAALFRKIPRAAAPKQFTELRPGNEVALEEGAVARTASGVVWVRHTSGGSRFLGLPSLELRSFGFLVPVSDETWLVSLEPTVLSCVGTGHLIRSGSLWEGLARFHDLFLDYVELKVAEGRQAEHQRLETKIELDRAALDVASRRLASVLHADSAPPVAATVTGRGSDPLFLAARIVAESQGVELETPPEPRRDPKHGPFLNRICAASRVRHRLVILRGEWWQHDNGPLLGFIWKDGKAVPKNRLLGRPVALLPTSPESYELVDPQTGERTPVDASVADSLEGEAFMLYSPLPERALKLADLVRLALRGRRRDLMTILLMGTGGGLLSLLVPILTGEIFGRIIPSADRNQLFQMTLALAVAAGAALAFQITRSIAVLRISGKLDGSVQAAIWDRLLALPVHFYRQFSIGDLARRSMGIDRIRTLLLGNVVTSFLGAAFSVFSFALLFYYSWKLALVALALVGALLAIAVVLVFFQVRYQRDLLFYEGKVAALLFGILSGLSKLRIASAEARGFALWAEGYSKLRRVTIKAQRLANIQITVNSVYTLLTAMALFAVMGLSTQLDLSISQFLAFNAAFGQFQAAALSMIGLLSSILTMVPIYERLEPILKTPPEVDPAKADVGELSGDVELGHVSFRYKKDGPLILDDVTIRARPGEMVALVGSSGSGKSTSVRLLLGFETPEAGGIYFDGQDLSSLDIVSVRRQIGVVLQTDKPLVGDIYNNIVGNANLSIEDAWEAARMAGIDEDIKQMPMGMHTIISEGGGSFSGGQQQRLLIARAIVHRPRILIFDEATSALDNRTQEMVTESLERLKATRIVVAHRLTTIRNADRIYVLEKGRMVEEGTYDELMAGDGYFYRMAQRQIA